MKKKSSSSILTTSEAPLLIPPEQIALLAQSGIRVLQLHFPMMPSINEKYGHRRGQHRVFYTNSAYARMEEQTRRLVQSQVLAAGWTVSKEDRYFVVLDFPFKKELVADLDGPIKATIDCLQQEKPSGEELRELVTPELLQLWKDDRPPAIENDSRIRHLLLVKHPWQPEMECQVTIYASSSEVFRQVLPLHILLHQYLLNSTYKG